MCEVADIGMGFGLVAAGYLDFRKRYLPVWLLAVLNVISVVLCILIRRNSLLSVLGGIIIGVLFFLASRLSGESIGYGDSWLILILGIFLGVRQLLGVVFVASFLASLVSLLLCLRHSRIKRKGLPFAPFLSVAYGLVVFL